MALLAGIRSAAAAAAADYASTGLPPVSLLHHPPTCPLPLLPAQGGEQNAANHVLKQLEGEYGVRRGPGGGFVVVKGNYAFVL